ncbi:MAG: undecaprenyldiphospho-muramoylpentapeptide beta-N-acetylglucosaminyltransferase [bacterium]
MSRSDTPSPAHVLVVGGGSAGHVIPALPVIAELQQQGYQVSFVGTRSGLEEQLTAASGVRFYAVSAGKLRRYWSWQNVTDLFRILRGVLQSIVLVRRLQPDVVFSKGGFVSFPVALAAWLWRVPVVAHESDLTPGLANRLVLPFVRTLCVSFAQTAQVSGATLARARVVLTGTPLREEITSGDAVRGRQILGLTDDDKPLLVVTGGSLGADALNAALRAALPELTRRYVVLHVCGPGKRQTLDMPGYIQREYIDEGWGDLLAAAAIVLSRAGANALFELLSLAKLNVLVPLSAKASRGDQIDNARVAAEAGYSVVLAEADLNTDTLLAALTRVEENRDQFAAALARFERPPAVPAIVREITAAIGLQSAS